MSTSPLLDGAITTLLRSEPRTLIGLSRFLSVPTAQIAQSLAELERQGLIHKEADADQYRYYLQETLPYGNEVVESKADSQPAERRDGDEGVSS